MDKSSILVTSLSESENFLIGKKNFFFQKKLLLSRIFQEQITLF